MPNSNSPSPSNSALLRRLSALATGPHGAALRRGLRGIEKESLRVRSDGTLATTPHPPAFGSALTHPLITTDYSEALVELITPADPDVAITMERLDQLHRFAYEHLGDELLWNESMPGPLPADQDIPIAWYGTSNIGMLKHVYRCNVLPVFTSTIRWTRTCGARGLRSTTAAASPWLISSPNDISR
jgi:glutamate--cysteine ligase